MQNTFLLHSRRRRAGNQPARIIICCYARSSVHTQYIYSKVSAAACDAIQTRHKGHFFHVSATANSWKDFVYFVPWRGHSIFTPPNSHTKVNARALCARARWRKKWLRALAEKRIRGNGAVMPKPVSNEAKHLRSWESMIGFPNNALSAVTRVHSCMEQQPPSSRHAAPLCTNFSHSRALHDEQKKATSYNLVSTGKWVFALKLPCRWSRFLNINGTFGGGGTGCNSPLGLDAPAECFDISCWWMPWVWKHWHVRVCDV